MHYKVVVFGVKDTSENIIEFIQSIGKFFGFLLGNLASESDIDLPYHIHHVEDYDCAYDSHYDSDWCITSVHRMASHPLSPV